MSTYYNFSTITVRTIYITVCGGAAVDLTFLVDESSYILSDRNFQDVSDTNAL